MASKRFIRKAQDAYREAKAAGDADEATRIFRALEMAYCGESDATCRHLSGWEPKLGKDGRA